MPNAAPEYKARAFGTAISCLRRPGWARRSAWTSLCAAAAFVAASAFAPERADAEINLGNEARSASYAYKFYVGGVLIGKANFVAKMGDGDYFTEGLLETEGVSDWFVAATVAAEARGRISKTVVPKQMDVSGKTEKINWRMTIAYQGDAPSTVSSQPPFSEKPYEIDPTEQKGALDPMSALVATLAPTKSGNPCGRTIPIFDGRKRYDIVFGKLQSKGVGKSGHPSFICKATWKRIGGFKPKMMEKKNITFNARFEERDGLFLPVRVWGKTEFGDAIAILR